ncbi:MAG TPA: DNA recombination protein RmuC, partial [Phaeodactylibacter sp.]|nr:DNA recombination protein RmuC [Phaeodactylibacter sp.]
MVEFTEIIFLGIGLLVGAIAAWFIAKYKFTGQSGSLPLDEIQNKYILKEVHEALQNQADLYRDDLLDKEKELRNLGSQLSSKEMENTNLQDQLISQKTEVTQLQQRFQTEFENIANRLLEENSQKFTRQNQLQLHHILNPLKEKIQEFETGVNARFLEETRDRISLKKEIEQLRELNIQLSQDANSLVTALKGESKTQGDWGEFQLETILEKAGLKKDIHYLTQSSYKDHQGNEKRPDFIINLPDGKHLVIDSKVSLTAYEKYFNAEQKEKKNKHLKRHTDSVRQHLKDLNKKNYQQLYQINSPDYVLMFVPIEPAFALAVQTDKKIFLDALDKNIVIVTTSTLLATMRT